MNPCYRPLARNPARPLANLTSLKEIYIEPLDWSSEGSLPDRKYKKVHATTLKSASSWTEMPKRLILQFSVVTFTPSNFAARR